MKRITFVSQITALICPESACLMHITLIILSWLLDIIPFHAGAPPNSSGTSSGSSSCSGRDSKYIVVLTYNNSSNRGSKYIVVVYKSDR